jgi:hypothetical protein
VSGAVSSGKGCNRCLPGSGGASMGAAGNMLDIFSFTAARTSGKIPNIPSLHPFSVSINFGSVFDHPLAFARA